MSRFVFSVCLPLIIAQRFNAGESCHNNILVPSGTTEAPANKHGSVVPEGTLDFFGVEPSVKTLGYYQGKGDAKQIHEPRRLPRLNAPHRGAVTGRTASAQGQVYLRECSTPRPNPRGYDSL